TGKLRRLIINVLPRSLKSHMASVAFPAYLFGHNPSAHIICASYAQDLADKLAGDCRSLMMSDFYRELFPATRFATRRTPLNDFMTTEKRLSAVDFCGRCLDWARRRSAVRNPTQERE